MVKVLKRQDIVLPIVIGFLGLSCQPAPQKPPVATETQIDWNTTIGDLATVVESPQIPVRGYGIVAGLFGAGSSECPVELRAELEKYIWQQIPDAKLIRPSQFIESLDTAVVEVVGTIPSFATPGQTFDVVVRPLSVTQTVSLSGGYLYTTELKEAARYTRFGQFAKTIAKAQGPIFTDLQSADLQNKFYILGGGYPITNVPISLIITNPNFVVAAAIRNRINERFGPKTANAVSDREVQLAVPKKYEDEKVRFLDIVRQVYLAEDAILKRQRIQNLCQQMQLNENKYLAEVALEAIGRPALDNLAVLLASPEPSVRFHAARCMARIGDKRAFEPLRDFVYLNSQFKNQALEVLGAGFSSDKVDPVLLWALGQEDLTTRLAAYQASVAAKSSHWSRTVVAESFFVDRLLCDGPKVIYVYRKDRPGIVIFGSPIRAKQDIFYKSSDELVLINSQVGDKYIRLSRQHPARPRLVGPILSGYELTQIIRALAETPEPKEGTTTLPGLGLAYEQVVAIIGDLCRQGFIDATVVTSEMTSASAIFGDVGSQNP